MSLRDFIFSLQQSGTPIGGGGGGEILWGSEDTLMGSTTVTFSD